MIGIQCIVLNLPDSVVTFLFILKIYEEFLTWFEKLSGAPRNYILTNRSKKTQNPRKLTREYKWFYSNIIAPDGKMGPQWDIKFLHENKSKSWLLSLRCAVWPLCSCNGDGGEAYFGTQCRWDMCRLYRTFCQASANIIGG